MTLKQLIIHQLNEMKREMLLPGNPRRGMHAGDQPSEIDGRNRKPGLPERDDGVAT